MRILSLPKYNMPLEDWAGFIVFPFLLMIGLALFIKSCGEMSEHIATAEATKAKQLELCTPICYPNLVHTTPATLDGQCICNTSLEYKKP